MRKPDKKKMAMLEAAYAAGMRDEAVNPLLCEYAELWISENYPNVREDTRQELVEEYSNGFYGEPPAWVGPIDYREIVREALEVIHRRGGVYRASVDYARGMEGLEEVDAILTRAVLVMKDKKLELKWTARVAPYIHEQA